jgi:hypothetical protein
MKLLSDRYAPITHAIGFLEADFSAVSAADLKWRTSLSGYAFRPLRAEFPGLLDSLLPLTGPLLRNVWVRTAGPWTAYFDNSVNGSDPFGPVSYLAQQIGCRGVTIGYRPQSSKAEGGTSFSRFGPEKTDFLNYVRSISAINDGGRWRWDTWGTIQPFEETQRYQMRRIRDRLAPDMLERYCNALGIRPFEDAFYGDEGYLVENRNVKCEVRTLTLKQAQDLFGV